MDSFKQEFSEEDKERMINKCDEIIAILEDFNIAEKYFVVKNLYESFLDACKKKDINFIEKETSCPYCGRYLKDCKCP